jgi:hypothetical protein
VGRQAFVPVLGTLSCATALGECGFDSATADTTRRIVVAVVEDGSRTRTLVRRDEHWTEPVPRVTIDPSTTGRGAAEGTG